LIVGLSICFDVLHIAQSFLGSIKKTAPGGGGWKALLEGLKGRRGISD